jgi:hypothetical protein
MLFVKPAARDGAGLCEGGSDGGLELVSCAVAPPTLPDASKLAGGGGGGGRGGTSCTPFGDGGELRDAY